MDVLQAMPGSLPSLKLTSSPVKTGRNAPKRKLVLKNVSIFRCELAVSREGNWHGTRVMELFLVVGGICFVFVELVGCFSFQIIAILNLKDCNLFEA